MKPLYGTSVYVRISTATYRVLGLSLREDDLQVMKAAVCVPIKQQMLTGDKL